jgi:solute carrier family 25 protein 33/36
MEKDNSNANIPPPQVKWAHFIAGGVGGSAGVLITSPLDVVKTRLQALEARSALTAVKPKYVPATMYSFAVIWKQEGLKGFWRGIVPNLMGVAPSRAVHFGFYSFTKDYMIKRGIDKDIVHFVSAFMAGAMVKTISNPIFLVKTRMQLQPIENPHYKNSFDCARKVLHEEGLRGFYKGLGASYIGLSESSIQFVLYEKFKAERLASKLAKHQPTDGKPPTLSQVEYIFFAGAAKLIASVITYPHEVVRTRLREEIGPATKYKGIFQTMKIIMKEESVVGLYGGLGAHLLRVVPNAAVLFWTYELTMKLLGAS